MTIEENIFILAKMVFTTGTINNGNGCLQPSDFHRGHNDDAIIDAYDVTHYDREWVEAGKSIRLKFYKAEAFGASQPDINAVVFETIVEV